MKTKQRLDDRLVELGLAPSKTKAQAMIMAGEVRVGERIQSKPGTSVKPEQAITLLHEGPRYVSRGGQKLAGALDAFGFQVAGLRCLDVGASTGGFSDCLLQRGAAHVYACDVGTQQLDTSLRTHPRLTFQENLHVRNLSLDFVGSSVDLAVMDVSFISVLKALPFVLPLIKAQGHLLALIKPQFEATPKDLVKGVVKNELRRQAIVKEVLAQLPALGLTNCQVSPSVLKGPKGNQEVFALLRLT